jgi:predicted ribosomally synthesized peptide with nif11-like leader
MSLESVKQFYERLAQDESLRQAIQSVQSKDECSQVVKQAGFDFTPEEFEEYTAELLERSLPDDELSELDERELEAVLGGFSKVPFPGDGWVQPMYGVIIWPPKPPVIQPMYGVIQPGETM